MKRNKLVLRQKTKISQRLPDDLEEKITSFQSEPDCDVCDDGITPEQWQELFGESDDEEEFHGF